MDIEFSVGKNKDTQWSTQSSVKAQHTAGLQTVCCTEVVPLTVNYLLITKAEHLGKLAPHLSTFFSF